jgi:hypothetical protein
MGFFVGKGVKHCFSKKSGIVIACSVATPSNVIVRFGSEDELVNVAELQTSDHLQNPPATDLVNRLNTFLEDSRANQVASNLCDIDGEIIGIEELPYASDVEVLYSANSKYGTKKISAEFLKNILMEVENQLS